MKTISKRKICVSVLLIVLLLFLLVFLDQLTKGLAVNYLKNGKEITLIPGILDLVYLENQGGAFSLMANAGPFQIVMAVVTPVVLALIAFFSIHSLFIADNDRFRPLRIDLMVLFAGALGNYIDRIRQQYVVDFIYFSAINFPVFNVADIYVTISVVVLFLLIIFYYKDRELSDFFRISKVKGNNAEA